MFRGAFSVFYKESIHILRDPKTLFLMLLVPGIQLVVFGYAIDLDVKHIPTVVYNLDGREPSRELLDTFTNTGYFDIVSRVHSEADLMERIIEGRAKVGIRIPPDYTDSLLLRTPAQVQVLIDGSDSNVALQALNVSNAIAQVKSLELVTEQLGAAFEPPIEARPRMLFNPDMRTANFMVPGLVGIIMQLVTMFLTGFAIVREKETGTLEQLMVTPVSRMGLMAGKLMPYAVVGSFEAALVLVLMRYLFGVTIAGNLFLLAAFSLVFLFTALGMGLFISTVAESQVQAMQLHPPLWIHLSAGSDARAHLRHRASDSSHLLHPHSSRHHPPGRGLSRAVARGREVGFDRAFLSHRQRAAVPQDGGVRGWAIRPIGRRGRMGMDLMD